MRLRTVTGGLLVLAAAVAACSGGASTEEADVNAPSTIRVTSDAFADGQPIPRRFTCDGEGLSPPLAWTGVPDGTAALALVVDDPDAPRGTFVHWVLLDVPTTVTGLETGQVPAGASQARNSAGRNGWFGPCPPSGTHHYRFTVYALGDRTDLASGAPLDRALHSVESNATAQGRLVGTYRRP